MIWAALSAFRSQSFFCQSFSSRKKRISAQIEERDSSIHIKNRKDEISRAAPFNNGKNRILN